MKRSKSVKLWSTSYEELTGQAIVTRRVAEHVLTDIGDLRKNVFPPSSRPMAIASWAVNAISLWRDILLQRVAFIYLVCSRSNGGFLRDVPALLAAKLKLPVIVHCHGSDIISLLEKRKLSRLARWLYKDCRVIVPSAHLIAPLTPYVRAAHVCENFYSGSFENLDRGVSVRNEGLTVFWNSNVMASKGFFDAFAAIKLAREDGYHIRMVSVGSLVADQEVGLSALQSNFSRLGSPDWFDYRGKQSHRKTIDMLAEADVICLPSRYSSELQPIALVEAMCSGKAIVASDIPALRATLSGYSATFVGERSVSNLTAALRSLADEKASDPAAFHKRRARDVAEARQRFSVERFDREMKRLMRNTQDRAT